MKKTADRFGRMVPADSAVIVIAIVVGVFLRLHLILDQVLLDDEWHSLHYVIGKSFGYLLTHFSIPGATSIPLNVYTLALLKTTGWNELLLRLPSIVAGISALVVFPHLVRPLIERRPTLLFTMLLAISPFLVFYSRSARPYSLFAAFGFASLMFGYRWLCSGHTIHRFAYVLTGVLAVECHLFALPTVVMPLVVGFLFKLRHLRSQDPLIAPSWNNLAICWGVLIASVGLLQGPALLETVRTTMTIVAGRDAITLESAWNAACLLSGTANPALVLVFMSILVHGLQALFRKNALAASLFVAVIVATLVSMFAMRPDSINAAIVIARYGIVFYPISYLLVAIGFDDLLVRSLKMVSVRYPVSGTILQYLLPVCFVVTLFLAGPLWQLYEPPNNFTNHSAFQQSYRRIAWDKSFSSEMKPREFTADTLVRREELSPFYHRLGMEKGAGMIVEFPVMIGDHFNPYYYYQHFHRKRVLIGYDPNCPVLMALAPGTVLGSTYVDEVLGRVAERRKIKLQNMVDMTDIEALRRSGARYIILHTRFEGELSLFSLPHPGMDSLYRLYERNFGPPIYRDYCLDVFMIYSDAG